MTNGRASKKRCVPSRGILRTFLLILTLAVRGTRQTSQGVLETPEAGGATSYVEKYPIEGFVKPLAHLARPQHGSHLDNGWPFGHFDTKLGVAAVNELLMPPVPPSTKCPPQDCCDSSCLPNDRGECCKGQTQKEVEDVPKEPPTQTRDYRKPPPFVEFNLDGVCKPAPCLAEPSEAPSTGGVRVTIRGEFLAHSMADIEEIRICGVPCTDIAEESDAGTSENICVKRNKTLTTEPPEPETKDVPCWIDELLRDAYKQPLPLEEFFLYRPTTKLSQEEENSDGVFVSTETVSSEMSTRTVDTTTITAADVPDTTAAAATTERGGFESWFYGGFNNDFSFLEMSDTKSTRWREQLCIVKSVKTPEGQKFGQPYCIEQERVAQAKRQFSAIYETIPWCQMMVPPPDALAYSALPNRTIGGDVDSSSFVRERERRAEELVVDDALRREYALRSPNDLEAGRRMAEEVRCEGAKTQDLCASRDITCEWTAKTKSCSQMPAPRALLALEQDWTRRKLLERVDMERCVLVCHKDECKGTITNKIPRGERWILHQSDAEDSGCCFARRGSCDRCCPPPPLMSNTVGNTIQDANEEDYSSLLETGARGYGDEQQNANDGVVGIDNGDEQQNADGGVGIDEQTDCTGGESKEYLGQPARNASKGKCKARDDCELTPTESVNGAHGCKHITDPRIMCCSRTPCVDTATGTEGFCATNKVCDGKEGWMGVSDTIYKGTAEGCRHLPDDVRCCVPPESPPPQPNNNCTGGESTEFRGQPVRTASKGVCKARDDCELTPTESVNGAHGCEHITDPEIMCCSRTLCIDNSTGTEGFCATDEVCSKRPGWMGVSDTIYGGSATGCRHLPDDVRCCVPPETSSTEGPSSSSTEGPSLNNDCTGGESTEYDGQPARNASKGVCKARDDCELTPTESVNGAHGCEHITDPEIMCCSRTPCVDTKTDVEGFCTIESVCKLKGEYWTSVRDKKYEDEGGSAEGCRHLPDDVRCCVELIPVEEEVTTDAPAATATTAFPEEPEIPPGPPVLAGDCENMQGARHLLPQDGGDGRARGLFCVPDAPQAGGFRAVPLGFWQYFDMPRPAGALEGIQPGGVPGRFKEKAERRLPKKWEYAYDDQTRRYYVNREKGDVRWGHPALPAGWTEATDWSVSPPISYFSHRSMRSSAVFPRGPMFVRPKKHDTSNDAQSSLAETSNFCCVTSGGVLRRDTCEVIRGVSIDASFCATTLDLKDPLVLRDDADVASCCAPLYERPKNRCARKGCYALAKKRFEERKSEDDAARARRQEVLESRALQYNVPVFSSYRSVCCVRKSSSIFARDQCQHVEKAEFCGRDFEPLLHANAVACCEGILAQRGLPETEEANAQSCGVRSCFKEAQRAKDLGHVRPKSVWSASTAISIGRAQDRFRFRGGALQPTASPLGSPARFRLATTAVALVSPSCSVPGAVPLHQGTCVADSSLCASPVVTNASSCTGEAPFCCVRVSCGDEGEGSCMTREGCKFAGRFVDETDAQIGGVCARHFPEDENVVCCAKSDAGASPTSCPDDQWLWQCPESMWCAGRAYCRPCRPALIEECANRDAPYAHNISVDGLYGFSTSELIFQSSGFPSYEDLNAQTTFGDCVRIEDMTFTEDEGNRSVATDSFTGEPMPSTWIGTCLRSVEEHGVDSVSDPITVKANEYLDDAACPEGCDSCDGVPAGGHECIDCEDGYRFIPGPVRLDGWQFGTCERGRPRYHEFQCGECPEGSCNVGCPKGCSCCLLACAGDPQCDESTSCVSCESGYFLDESTANLEVAANQSALAGMSCVEEEAERSMSDEDRTTPVRAVSCTTTDASDIGDLAERADFVYVRSRGCEEIRPAESTEFKCVAPPSAEDDAAAAEDPEAAYRRMMELGSRENLPPEKQPVCCVSIAGAITAGDSSEDNAAKVRAAGTKKKKKKGVDDVAECVVELGGHACPDGFLQVAATDAFHPIAFGDSEKRSHFESSCEQRRTEVACMTLSPMDKESGNVCEWRSKKKKCVRRARCCGFFTAPNIVGPTRCGRARCIVEDMPQNGGERCCVAPESAFGGNDVGKSKNKKKDDTNVPSHRCMISRGPCTPPFVDSEQEGPMKNTCCGGFYPNKKEGACVPPVAFNKKPKLSDDGAFLKQLANAAKDGDTDQCMPSVTSCCVRKVDMRASSTDDVRVIEQCLALEAGGEVLDPTTFDPELQRAACPEEEGFLSLDASHADQCCAFWRHDQSRMAPCSIPGCTSLVDMLSPPKEMLPGFLAPRPGGGDRKPKQPLRRKKKRKMLQRRNAMEEQKTLAKKPKRLQRHDARGDVKRPPAPPTTTPKPNEKKLWGNGVVKAKIKAIGAFTLGSVQKPCSDLQRTDTCKQIYPPSPETCAQHCTETRNFWKLTSTLYRCFYNAKDNVCSNGQKFIPKKVGANPYFCSDQVCGNDASMAPGLSESNEEFAYPSYVSTFFD